VASGRQPLLDHHRRPAQQLPDIDPEETKSGFESFDTVVRTRGRSRARLRDAEAA